MNRHEGQGATSKYSCKLQLPCNAPLETVEGPVCTSIRGAQQVGFLGIILYWFQLSSSIREYLQLFVSENPDQESLMGTLLKVV
jgi:hypothetical protein